MSQDKNRVFLGAGSCRKAFSLPSGRCLKVALDERKEAGTMQNRAEFLNCSSLSSSGKKFSCFPEVYSHSDDFTEIEVQKCSLVTASQITEMFKGDVDLTPYDVVFKRHDPWSYMPLDNQFQRWFAFVFSDFFTKTVDFMEVNLPFIEPLSVESVLKCFDSASFDEFRGMVTFEDISSFLKKVIEHKCTSSKYKTIYDLLDFYITFGRSQKFMLPDLWNSDQWGLAAGEDGQERLVVIDSGYSKELADSAHYKKDSITPLNQCTLASEGSSPHTFNGVNLKEIKSPRGGSVVSKFYTKSEYILANDGMSKHIKHLGLSDDGMWSWSDMLVFMPLDKLSELMRIVSKFMTLAKKISYEGDTLLVEVPDGSERGWREVFRVEGISYEPKIGLNVCEFTFDGFDGKSGVMKRFHPGHDVTFIEDITQEAKEVKAA